MADPTQSQHPPRLAVLASFSGSGGVERMLVNLISGFVAAGRRVDLLLIRDQGPHLASLPEEVERIPLGSQHSLLAIPALARYLRHRRPQALLAAKDRAGRAAVLARALAGVNTRLVLRLGTNLSASLEGRSALRRFWRYWPIRQLYPRIDRIIAVSAGVAMDTAAIAGLPRETIMVIRNPVITPDLTQRAAEPCPHPWFHDAGPPVLVGAGRLQRQKDFPTLIRAFARVRQTRPCRLVIIGEGRERPALEALIGQLGLTGQVDLPGFQANPLPFLAHASLFVLSSAWEGSPNVLTEAMALGTPVVATDCPSGPAELLDGGRIAPLVPVGDPEALARMVLATLDQPTPAARLKDAVADYDQAYSARRYLAELEAG
ncbi:MAG: glycosyltransferase [Chromatiaceae bacterium]|nr:glycosyltransferase [Candidatus Thioaporhodococcus sediminis]